MITNYFGVSRCGNP